MIGFDRPLKPSWIYNFIKVLNVGDKFSEHKAKLDSFLFELNGEEGKRKVRTVLTRYYLKLEENPNSRFVEYTPILDVCKSYTLKEIQPLLLFYLLMRSSLIRILTKIISEIYGSNRDINYPFLRKKIVERFGERDITSRSLSNFLNTVVNFGVLEKESRNLFKWKNKLKVNDLNFIFMLRFYSEVFKKSPEININELESYLFLYFDTPDVLKVAKKFNSLLWEYSSRFGTNQILFDKSYKWDKDVMSNIFNKV
ncbi:hypothetical protein LCGC14_1108490 [marine sediment metagenome]|uniref:DUF1819 domain-containing protein n=1 Tax=marine sediment metagenome TaxID=412755 RepID=A0A0F9QDQ9_9ZZZZ